jgi:hypothetical protein
MFPLTFKELESVKVKSPAKVLGRGTVDFIK